MQKKIIYTNNNLDYKYKIISNAIKNKKISFAKALLNNNDEHIFEKIFNIKIKVSPNIVFENRYGYHKDGYPYESSYPIFMGDILNNVEFNENDIIWDSGCGTGFALICFATKKVKHCKGIEIQYDIFRHGEANVNSIQDNPLFISPIEIIHGDVNDPQFDLSDGTKYYLYNPFGEKTFTNILNKIENSLKPGANPRHIEIIYTLPNGLLDIVPGCRNILDATPWMKLKKSFCGDLIEVWENKP
ncbi:hypothetical protein ACFL56_03360 [Candidatus Margulisiibacteriota bacterium]